MRSNVFLTNKSSDENISFSNDQKANLFLVINEVKDLKKTINLTLKNNNLVNIYCLILANKSNKFLNINIDHKGNNSQSNIYVKSLANNKSHVKVNCVSSCQSKTNKNIINQTIDGLIFDNDSTIQALPCLDININDIVAKHTVNIGQVNPEIIFYLNTKGLSKLEAYQFLIDSFISDLNPCLKQYKININNDIRSLMRGSYE